MIAPSTYPLPAPLIPLLPFNPMHDHDRQYGDRQSDHCCRQQQNYEQAHCPQQCLKQVYGEPPGSMGRKGNSGVGGGILSSFMSACWPLIISVKTPK